MTIMFMTRSLREHGLRVDATIHPAAASAFALVAGLAFVKHGAVRLALPLGLACLLSVACSAAPQVVAQPDGLSELASRIKLALIEANTGAASIRVDVDTDAVTLGGFVASDDERQLALRIARKEAGDTDVVDSLTVRR